MDLDYKVLSGLIIKCIRGDRSQERVSNEMNFTFNQFYRWESGLHKIQWQDFIDVCKICKVDLQGAINTFFVNYRDDLPSDKVFSSLFGCDREKIGNIMGLSSHKLRRLQAGDTQLSFPLVLEIFDRVLDILPSFLHQILDVQKLGEYGELFYSYLDAKRFCCLNPQVELIIGFFKHAHYHKLDSHSDEFIAEKLNMPIEFVSSTVEKLVILGVVEELEGKYVTRRDHVDMRGESNELIQDYMKYWINLAATKTEGHDFSSQTDDLFTNLVFGWNESTKREVYEVYHRFYTELVNISSKSLKDGPWEFMACMQANRLNLKL